jgi:hypothetical protein
MAICRAMAVGVAAFGLVARAHAQSLPLDLTWEAPSECPSAERIRRELERITRPRPGRQLTPLVARALITRSGMGYHLTLETERSGALSKAQLDNPTCEPLSRAATLVLALAYGDGVDIREDEPEKPDASVLTSLGEGTAPSGADSNSSRSAHAVSTALRQASLDRRPPRSRRLEIAPWVGATGTSGLIAAFALGTEVGVQLRAMRWLASWRVDALPQREAAKRGAVSAQLSDFSAALGGCAQAPVTTVLLATCARFEAGVLRARSEGARVDGSASPTWFAVAPSLLARIPIASPFALRAELGALIPLSVSRFVVAGEGALYQTTHVAPELGLGLEITL